MNNIYVCGSSGLMWHLLLFWMQLKSTYCLVLRSRMTVGGRIIVCRMQDEGYIHFQVFTLWTLIQGLTHKISSVHVAKWDPRLWDMSGYLAEFTFKRAFSDHRCRLHNFLPAVSAIFRIFTPFPEPWKYGQINNNLKTGPNTKKKPPSWIEFLWYFTYFHTFFGC